MSELGRRSWAAWEGTAHFRARELSAFGHDGRLMPLAYVKPYVQKNDAADAEALRAEGGQSEIAHDVDPIGLAVVAASAEFGIGAMVQARIEYSGGRMKKTTIVALARKLLVALWKYVRSVGAASVVGPEPPRVRDPGGCIGKGKETWRNAEV